MDIQRLDGRTIFIKFSTGGVLINPNKKQKEADMTLTTYPVSIDKWEIKTDNALSGGGEFEKSNIYVQGFTELGKKDYQTATYSIDGEDISVLMLGDLNKDTYKNAIANFTDMDILVLYDDIDLSVSQIASILANISANVLVLVGDKTEVHKKIIKEVGGDEENGNKFSIKKKNMPTKAKVVILS